MTEQLWNLQNIAEFFNTSKSTVCSRIVTRPDFPKPVSFPGFGKRWVPEEVREWAKSQRVA